MGQKKTIPSIFDAKNDGHHGRNMAHALEQVKHGHYRLEPVAEDTVEPGRVRITFDRVETSPGTYAEHHGLFAAK